MISEHASPLGPIGGVDSGGQNVYVAHVARCLAQQGHQVDVFTRRDNAALKSVVDVAPGWRVIHVRAGSESFVPKEQLLPLMPEFATFCKAWMRTAPRYDVVHANFFMSGWVGLRLKETFEIPLVTTFHALGKVRREHQKEADAFPPERLDIEHALVINSDRIIAECPQDLSDLCRLYGADPARIHTVPCGFDDGEFLPMRREQARARLSIPQDEFTVLQLGRMVPRKGVDTVVRAMACPCCVDMRLRVVGGDGDVPDPSLTPEIGRLMAIAAECGVADRVSFEGRKPRSELRYWYAASNVFVTMPWYEPFGITPLEAMACARPVVGSQVGGLQYSIEHGSTGFLVPPRDFQQLGAAIAKLRSDPALAASMGEQGLQRARRLFRWEDVALQLAGALQNAASRSPQIVTTLLPPAKTHRSGGAGRHQRRAPSPAIFLDKDGTLVEDLPYNVDPARVRLAPHAIEALALWRDAGYRLVVITNQPGIGLGRFDVAGLERLHRTLGRRLARARVPVDGFFACPHRAEVGCRCRKPQPGLILHAAELLRLDLRRSWIVGDILNDVEAGRRAGCRTVMLDVGHETEWQPGPLRTPHYRCTDLLQAARATVCAAVLAPVSVSAALDAVASV
jgi:histidinol-phosphate phosphatase family protein